MNAVEPIPTSPGPANAILRFEDVSFSYGAGDRAPVISNATFAIEDGSFCLVVGATGAGKSTLLQMVNGLVPRFSGGTLHGEVLIDGRSTASVQPRDLAGMVGYCPQDAASAFVTDTVETELAWTMEQLGIDRDTMLRRVESIGALLGLQDKLDRPVTGLSMGERQRLAVGSVLTAQPRILVLDEPTSMLDPLAAEELLAALDRLVHDMGLTVLISEHRLERVTQFCDKVIALCDDATVVVGNPEDAIAAAGLQTSMVRLADRLGWPHVPRSIRDARRLAAPLRRQLMDVEIASPPENAVVDNGPKRRVSSTAVLSCTDLWVQRGDRFAVAGAALTIHQGTIVALTGHNGSGKSTLLSALSGAERPARGMVDIDGQDPAALRGRPLISLIGWLPPTPLDLCTEITVEAELAANDRDGGLAHGSTAAVLASFDVSVDVSLHPRDLSAGQGLALALAILLAHRPKVLLLDEPTVGLDYESKSTLCTWLRRMADEGTTVLMATHDVEVAAAVADRVVTLSQGTVLADDDVRPALLAAGATAPQISRIFFPLPILRLEDLGNAR